MIKPEDVKPGRWDDLVVLSSNKEVSYCFGYYHNDDGTAPLSIGKRWNGDPLDPDDIGYPSYAGNPVWFREDPYLIPSVLAMLEADFIASNQFDKALTVIKARMAFQV